MQKMELGEQDKNGEFKDFKTDGAAEESIKIISGDDESNQRLLYNIKDHPPFHLTIVLGFQQALIALSGSLATSILVADVTCAKNNEYIKTQLLSSTLLMNGITTILMNIVGIRLPLFQGPAGDFLIPLLTMQMINPDFCDFTPDDTNGDLMSNTTATFLNATSTTSDEYKKFVLSNLSSLQGSLMAAGLIQFLIGATGFIGILLRFIGPVTVVPTIFVGGLFFVRAVIKFVQVHWGVSLLTAALALVLSLYLSRNKTPIPFWTRRLGFHIMWYPLHQVFSLLLAILIGWFVSAMMTMGGAFTDDPNDPEYLARTDAKTQIITDAEWFRIPYPGQFGALSFDVSVFTGFIIATITSILDSVGDYYACAQMCNVPPPPPHGVNRGIAIEGFCSVISGMLGCGHATTTIGGNIGAIGVTRVASRDVLIVAGVIYIIFGLISKVSAVFITIPYPVLGGALIVIFGMFNGVVLSNLKVISLSSSRNLAIIGTAILFGLMVPTWVEHNPDAIKTGSEMADGIVKMLIANPNLSGGGLACLLDNTVPGDIVERGIAAWQSQAGTSDATGASTLKYSAGYEIYEPLLPRVMKRMSLLKKLPFLPKRYVGDRL